MKIVITTSGSKYYVYSSFDGFNHDLPCFEVFDNIYGNPTQPVTI